ncbi:MAG TPA: hypothetical protein VHX49_03915 [Candidatus Acidoferrales bacterium]|nr:hypothetical protein [Candidatus Acidoferrales bacterium]
MATGKRVAPFLGLTGGWCPNDQTCYVRTPRIPPAGSALQSEVLDARSGKTIGAAFVQTAGGADTFDSVFSEGDWLVLARDGQRVRAISLSTRSEVMQGTGTFLPYRRKQGC